MSASLHGLFFLPSCCVLTTPIAGCQARLPHLSLHSPFRHGPPLNGGASEGRKKGRRNAAQEGGGLSRKATVQLDPPTKGGSWEELRKK